MSRKRTEPLRRRSRRTLLVFQVADQRYAVPSGDVAEILPMAELHSPPGIPSLLAGFLNLAGELVPVVRLHHLFGLPEAAQKMWTPLVILRESGRRLGLLVDSVNHTFEIDDHAVLPLPRQQVSSGCVTGIVRSGSHSLSLLSPEHLLLEQECRAIIEIQQSFQQRIDAVEGISA